MSVSQNSSIAIVGVGSSMSRSLAIWLAGLGWNIALLSRSESKLSAIANEVKKAQSNHGAKVIYRAADASDPTSLTASLDWCTQHIGKLDVLNYNAAHVAESDIMRLTPELLEGDMAVSAVGTLMAGQWFTKNARLDKVSVGELPLFLVTGGILDKKPDVTVTALSAAKAASQALTRIFAKVLPDKFNILVGMPLITGRAVDPETGNYYKELRPDAIIQKVFRPFFEGREKMHGGTSGWTTERVL